MMLTLPHTSNLSLEETVKAVQEQQERQAQQLERQRQSISELKAQLGSLLEDFQELRPPSTKLDVEDLDTVARKDTEVDDAGVSAVFEENDIPEYQLEHSMWDALLLLFFRRVCWPDKVVLFVGFLLNLGLQTGLLLVLWLDMIDETNYGPDKVEEMIKWRGLNGHSDANFDKVAGQSMVHKLCSRELWNFEQDQYNEMYDYLYKAIEGSVLSVLVLILWVLSTMIEYRRIVEQGLAIFRLPTVQGLGSFLVREDGDDIEIVAAAPLVRIIVIFVLLLPRLVVVGFLCIGGCKYLSETASLPDLVLNAMALAFILDVDEMLCSVLLPHRLRTKLDRVKPMPCSDRGRKMLGFVVHDWIRYMLTVGLVLIAVFVYLAPFHQNIEAAATALCGGQKDFSFKVDPTSASTITLMNSTGYIGSCSEEDRDAHMSAFYGIRANHSARTPTRDAEDMEAATLQAVLAYAFKGCDPDLLADSSGVCRPVPPALQGLLPDGVRPGANIDPAVCPTLQVGAGARACGAVEPPASCLWTWHNHRCEDDTIWPGIVHETACSANLMDSCDEWRHNLGRSHPTQNCFIVDWCGGPYYNCLAGYGQLDIEIRNYTLFNLNETLVWGSIEESLWEVINITELDKLDVVLETPPPRGTSPPSTQKVWTVRSLPTTFFLDRVLSLNESLLALANQKINSETGTSSTLAAVFIGDGNYIEDSEVEHIVQDWYGPAESGGSGGAGSGGGGGASGSSGGSQSGPGSR